MVKLKKHNFFLELNVKKIIISIFVFVMVASVSFAFSGTVGGV